MARAFDDASSQYLEIDSAVVTAYPLTMACWFNSDVDNLALELMWVGDKDVGDHFHSLGVHGVVVGDPVRCYTVGGGPTATASTTSGFSADTWHHAAAVFAASNDRAVLIDGGAKGTNSGAVTPANLDRTTIGRRGDSTPDRYWSGNIAEAAVWNIALSDDEIGQLADGASPLLVRPDSLVAYWPLLRSEDQDWVGGYDLTANGGPTVADHAPKAFHPLYVLY